MLLLLDQMSFVVSVMIQFMQNLCIDHLNIVIHVLRYLKKASRQRLLYENKGDTQIYGYCDVD